MSLLLQWHLLCKSQNILEINNSINQSGLKAYSPLGLLMVRDIYIKNDLRLKNKDSFH